MKIVIPIKKTLLASTLLLLSVACNHDEETMPSSHESSTHWEYEHTDWHTQGYSECAGKVQSPLNIETTQTVKAALPDIEFDYKAFPLTVLDNGHTIEVEGHGENFIKVKGNSYSFKQFHFHHNSEHSIDGQKSALELHMVHEDKSTGNLAVIGIFLKPGGKHAYFQEVLDNIPAQQKKPLETALTVNLNNWLPGSKDYYTYTGSLTTPPCSQGIQWYLMKEAVEVSVDQIAAFAKKYSNNARPTQPSNGRIVFEK